MRADESMPSCNARGHGAPLVPTHAGAGAAPVACACAAARRVALETRTLGAAAPAGAGADTTAPCTGAEATAAGTGADAAASAASASDAEDAIAGTSLSDCASTKANALAIDLVARVASLSGSDGSSKARAATDRVFMLRLVPVLRSSDARITDGGRAFASPPPLPAAGLSGLDGGESGGESGGETAEKGGGAAGTCGPTLAGAQPVPRCGLFTPEHVMRSWMVVPPAPWL